jgi:hypothetical protein
LNFGGIQKNVFGYFYSGRGGRAATMGLTAIVRRKGEYEADKMTANALIFALKSAQSLQFQRVFRW